MMHTIKVTAVVEVYDDSFDPDHETGLTSEAFDRIHAALNGAGLDNIEFEKEA